MSKVAISYRYHAHSREIVAGEEVLKHPSVLDFIAPELEGFTILHTGKFNPDDLMTDLGASVLKGLVPFAYKDGKLYLLPTQTVRQLFGAQGSVKSYSACLALNRPVRSYLNPSGTKYRMLVKSFAIDGVVAVMKESDNLRVTAAWRLGKGVTLFAKGGMIAASPALENCPVIPDEFDGVLNLSELRVNGYNPSDPECPNTLRSLLPKEGTVVELTVGMNLFIAQRVNLNIRKKGLSLHIAHMMNQAAQQRISSEAVRQLKKLMVSKAESKTAGEVARAIRPYLPPHGPLADLLDVLGEAGFIPADFAQYVPHLFDAAAVRILKKGPNLQQVFTTALPGAGLGKYQVLVPQAVWDALMGSIGQPYKDGYQIELWRNPLRPGLDREGRSLSCGVFDIVGIGPDEAFYVNSQTWGVMGGDFDLDPIAGYIPEFFTRNGERIRERMLGLGRVSNQPCPVVKIKTAEPPRPIHEVGEAVVTRASTSLSAHLGTIYNKCADLIDHAAVKGGDTTQKLMAECGSLMAAMLDAAVFTQKHEAKIQASGMWFSTKPGSGEGSLTFERCEDYLNTVASQIGKAAKSPTKAMELLRYVKGLESFVLRSRLQLGMIPREPVKGIWGSVLAAARQVGDTAPIRLNVQGETLVPYLLDLLRYECSQHPVQFDETPIPDAEITRMHKRFLEAQDKNPDVQIALLDNEWGLYSLGLAWSRDKDYGLASRAGLGARIVSLGKLVKHAKSTVEAVKLLSVDYRLLRKLGVEANKDLTEIEDIDPTLFSERELDEDEGGYDDAGNFIGGITF